MIVALRRVVVDSIEEIDVARERRERRGTEARDTGNVDCWADDVVDRRVETAVCELNPRFVDRAAAEHRDVADLHRLIRVAQTRAAADGVQSADVARVHGFDVIEAVTRAQLVALIDPMIDAHKKVGRVETRGHDAGLDQRSGINNCAQTVVDAGDRVRSNREHGRVVSPRLFEVSKEESSIAPYWTTRGAAVLRLRQQIFRRGEWIARVESLVAEEAVQVAAPIVCPSARQDVDNAT